MLRIVRGEFGEPTVPGRATKRLQLAVKSTIKAAQGIGRLNDIHC
jgi:hypothetical protein